MVFKPLNNDELYNRCHQQKKKCLANLARLKRSWISVPPYSKEVIMFNTHLNTSIMKNEEELTKINKIMKDK